MKLACVVHRFGPDVAGGSEGHCLQVARRLAAAHDVTVLTTCARDHVTWRNAYRAGPSTIDAALPGATGSPRSVHVERFPVARQRSVRRFADISSAVFDRPAPFDEQERWFRENGPESPALVNALAARGAAFDRVLFWSFRYYQTFFGLPLVADRAILLPTAEDDAAVRLDVLDRFFSLPAGFLFLTPEEQDLVARRCSRPLAPASVIGCGIDPAAPSPDADRLLDARHIARPYALYLGRIDRNKGCDTLLRHFERLHAGARARVAPRLVMAGPANMALPTGAPWLTALGYVDAALRDALLERASVLIVPSPFESLSMVLIEAWNHGVPALVNGRCAALRGQAVRSGGALCYRNVDEFEHALAFFFDDPEAARRVGAQGLAYVEREYRWPQVMGTIEAQLCSPPTPPPPTGTALSAASSARA